MMRFRRIPRPCPLATALLLALLAPSFGPAAAAQETAGAFGEVVDVALVNVEVWVTDDDGRPVLGLTAEDFEVREDGRPVPITFFAEVGSAGLAHSVTAPPAGTAEQPELPTVEAPGHWVIYVDQLHLSAVRQRRLLRDLDRFLPLSGIPPERVLVLRQRRDLVTEANFGSTRAEISQALSRIAEGEPAAGQLTAQAKRLALDRLQEMWEVLRTQNVPAPCNFVPARAVPEINRYARQARERVALSVANLKRAASFLAAVPGVKTVIYAGDALETHPGRDLMRFVRELCPAHTDAGRFQLPEGLGPELRELTRSANANRVTIYTLQTGGLRPDPVGGAQQRALDTLATARNVLGPAARDSERSGLQVLATETGGRAILNRNRLEEALEEIAREMSAYYSLAYEPPSGGDGREHRIEVRVKGRDLVTRHRLNYRAKPPAERLTDRLESALYLGVTENPLGMRLGAGDLTDMGEGLYSLRLHLLVPASEVVFLPHEDSGLARLAATVAVRTPGRPGVETVRRDLPVPRPPSDDALLDLVVPLELARGPVLLAVALRDLTSNETSVVSTGLEIQPPSPVSR
ncbi:MAG: VWA domain-containing protein [Thermoanaerobaculia bacterium]|nr:VWA domain-containing protein [Thermoanaerobaculia bacterium]